ncbi:MAG: hypothetical protein KatS3mg012_0610 [Gaiellaceae bacterium]|nr:MAG: hypothetical protein KatS3mg012_0610 [Gaiellaceae bacterium]
MESELTATLERAAHSTWRALALTAIGPLTVLAGVAWALVQPYRVTLLDPRAHGVWDHVVQPPLLVVTVGVLFHVVVVRPLVRALEGGS